MYWAWQCTMYCQQCLAQYIVLTSNNWKRGHKIFQICIFVFLCFYPTEDLTREPAVQSFNYKNQAFCSKLIYVLFQIPFGLTLPTDKFRMASRLVSRWILLHRKFRGIVKQWVILLRYDRFLNKTIKLTLQKKFQICWLVNFLNLKLLCSYFISNTHTQ